MGRAKLVKKKPLLNNIPAMIVLKFDELETFAHLTRHGMTLMDDRIYNCISKYFPHFIQREFKSDMPHKITNNYFIEFQITNYVELKSTFDNRQILLRAIVLRGLNFEIALGYEFMAKIRGSIISDKKLIRWFDKDTEVFSPLIHVDAIKERYLNLPDFAKDASMIISPAIFYHRNITFCTIKSDNSDKIEDAKNVFPNWCFDPYFQDTEYKNLKVNRKLGLPARKKIYLTSWKVPDIFQVGYYGIALPYREQDKIHICGEHLKNRPIEAYILKGLKYAFQEVLRDNIVRLLVVIDINIVIKMMNMPRPNDMTSAVNFHCHHQQIIDDINYWETLKLVDKFVQIDYKFISHANESDEVMNDLRKKLREYISSTVIY